ncbi:methylated-DNA--[protein]-cysteine S-methyltransferase [Rhizobium etli]|uniref:methylated-DNA--[protein]-cysteine S-methyltransferase n=1 Tax=Rhizobium etli TaxID=29449 RepID=A0A7W6ZMC8_RHIET|nr:methylated-DNA--[protein]-cysteine S-methyltransferase [Rhizobium etli]MBB4482473.1 methylated-DNA-[protein]-cysteine S-methyltransferase [Rhizobium etli]MBB4538302.1 methylated-DNA-[protein]-cysteine S-methyltransferase [Rhizobium etli]
MTPANSHGGPVKKVTLLTEHLRTPIGTLFLFSEEDGTLRLADWEDLSERMNKLLVRHFGIDGLINRASNQRSPSHEALGDYFDGDLNALANIRVKTSGTPFQIKVWEQLCLIPPGSTISYAELARRVGNPAGTRAVGAANGANFINIVVPCHRVIGSDASLTGYGSGLSRKRWLLDHENGVKPLFV